jgi:HD-GYP domain-containing protein (c-di-GMP phosphodiesterase class II)
MRKIPIDQLKPGMTLARTIFNDVGSVLLQRGVILSEAYINALRRRGFVAVFVRDGIADDIQPQEMISQRVRVAVRRHLRAIFVTLQRYNEECGGSEDCLKSGLGERIAPLIKQLCNDVENIVDEILSTEAISGIISLRSHDNYTFEHSVDVTVSGVLLGRKLHLPLDNLRQLALGCLLHDIGKLLVPQGILNKVEPLSISELAIIQQHPRLGYDIARHIVPPEQLPACHVVYQHHERQDGTGYPRGLQGGNGISVRRPGQEFVETGRILPIAEIAAVADVYSALASDRPYRPALEPSSIVTCLNKMAGNHLNREMVMHFTSIVPPFPVGSRVVITSGKLKGYSGVVAEVNPAKIHQPVVRIIFDPQRKEIAPFLVDTSQEPKIEIANDATEWPVAL